jgi:transcriptional regulator with XRE-family HTH domain
MSRRPPLDVSAHGQFRADEVPEVLGAKIRTERLATGLSGRGLAGRVGVSPSLISQIERGQATPSVATLWAIATELGLSVSDLFDGIGSARKRGDGAVQPHESRKAITLAGGIRWERLTTTPDREADFVYVVYPVGAASCGEDDFQRHGGREFGYVIRGTLGVRMGVEDYIVRANDSISFESSMPHRLWTIGDEAVEAIWMVINRKGDPRMDGFE